MGLKTTCRCGKVIPYGTKYCNECEQENKNSIKQYKARNYERDYKYNRYYSSGEWDKARAIVKSKQRGLDLYSYYVDKKIEYADTYHHIIPVKDDYDKRNNMDNIIGLTYSNHQLIHNEYDKSEGHKKVMQDKLLKFVSEWYAMNK